MNKVYRQGYTIHIIGEVTDTGTPPLTRYQQAVVEVNRVVFY